MARADPTDARWAALEPLPPKGVNPERPPAHTRRQLINGIRFQARTGIFERLQIRADAKELIIWDISVDSTIARTYQSTMTSVTRPLWSRASPARRSALRSYRKCSRVWCDMCLQ